MNLDGVIDIQDQRMGKPCNTDDIWDFKVSGLSFNEGPLKCDPEAPQTITMVWHFVDNEKSIYIDAFNKNAKIYKLTDTQFQVYTEDVSAGATIWRFSEYKR